MWSIGPEPDAGPCGHRLAGSGPAIRGLTALTALTALTSDRAGRDHAMKDERTAGAVAGVHGVLDAKGSWWRSMSPHGNGGRQFPAALGHRPAGELTAQFGHPLGEADQAEAARTEPHPAAL